uniref:SdrD B-like domain-containing protein n=1 Tax=Yoonia rhodophyticola TaxID=3137370 RepID=A0AAN0MAJ2_9RHOB
MKSAAAVLSDPPAVDDVVTYTYEVTNTGDTVLYNVSVSETTASFTGTGTPPAPGYDSGGTDEDGGAGTLDLLPGASMTFTAEYELTSDDLAAGGLENSAAAEGADPAGDPVTDTSDAGTDQDGAPIATPETTETPDLDGDTDADPTNDPTVLLIRSPPVANDDSEGGFTPGAPATLTDALTANDTDVDGTVQADRVSFVVPAGATGGTPDVDGDITSVTVPDEGTWTVDDSGFVTFTPLPGFEDDPTDITYTVADDDGLVSDPATIAIDHDQLPSLSVEKTADLTALQTPPQAGDEITYTYVVTNDGNVTLFDVTVDEVTFTGTNAAPAPGDESVTTNTSGDSADAAVDVSIDTLGIADTATFTAVYALSQADIDAGEITNQAEATGDNVTGTPVTDLSDDPTDPTDTPDDGDPADPTVSTLDQTGGIALIKNVLTVPDTNGDGLFGGEDDVIVFGFTVINTGNVTLSDITVDDPLLDAVTGGPITLAPGAADDSTFRGEYTVLDADITRGYFQNTATVDSDDPDGNAVTDVSDTGTDPDGDTILDPEMVESPDGTGATDTDPTNDPTVISIPANPEPELSVTKSIAGVTDVNANGITDAGDTIDYVFTVTNTGNLRLADVTIDDPLVDVPGSIDFLEILEVNSVDLTGTYEILPSNVTAGFVENTAEATGLAVNSAGDPITDGGVQLSATDTSDSGTEPRLDAAGDPIPVAAPEVTETPDGAGATDGDPRNDPTVLRIPSPGLTLEKSVLIVNDSNGDGLFGGTDDEIVFTFTVTNTGDTDLVGVTIDDPIVSVSGGPIDLAIGETDDSTFTATYTVLPADTTRTYVQNTATAEATSVDETGTPFFGPDGDPVEVTDISDSGTDADGTGIADPAGTETPDGAGNTDTDPTNDPTVVSIPLNPEAGIRLVKSATGVADTNGDGVVGAFEDLITYSFDVTNTGNLPLGDVVVNDDALGGVIATIPRIDVAETVTVTFGYEISDDDFFAGEIVNTATATGGLINDTGDEVRDPVTGDQITATDVSDTGTNRDLTTVGTPETTETPDADGSTDGDPTNDPTVTDLPLTPSGASISGVFFIDNNRDDDFDGGTDEVQEGVVVTLRDDEGRIVGTTTTGPDGSYSLSGFPVGDDYVLTFTASAGGLILDEITGLDFDLDTILTDQNGWIDPTGTSDLILVKETASSTVILGENVLYTITVTNTGTGPASAVDVTDTLPAGMLYVDGSATIDDVPATPVVTGRTQTFEDVFVAAGASVTIALQATVLPNAPFGDLTNTASVIDPVTGTRLARDTATVSRPPEAVFDCAVVIGKVFDDRNFNGYQDGAPDLRSQITNQDIFTGKFGISPQASEPKGEPGLPNVRLVTPTGTVITTDAFGRYSVPCAELPGPTGTNFTLKLDPRSLPTGYRITTENPRTMRLTAGIMTEMNFGAALGQVLDVDLTAAAFDGTTPVDRLDQGLTQLLRQVADTPSVVRISYFTNGETADVARARVAAVEELIEDRWDGIGRYQLIVETTIKQLQ